MIHPYGGHAVDYRYGKLMLQPLIVNGIFCPQICFKESRRLMINQGLLAT
ncbi:hypothetical protein PEPS_35570 (plasmid) [Persicobacter psychrovividus]|uniref:Uncharacterized protein n=1 Tax=Persicobacter psychrovividus TaxID=387638 RepID=A0ABM7VJX1_9BACT|nr:hypothetical protein PEPS_35570 [Persicobacter psychrovividus]